EDPVLGEQVIADRDLREQVLLEQFLLLSEPGEEEEELRLEGELVAVLVEAGEERVLLDDLEHGAGAEPFREGPRERRLPDADRPFHDDVAVLRIHAGAEISTNAAGLQ